MEKFETVAAYLKAQSPKARTFLNRMRAAIRKAAKVEEVISYGIPGYTMQGRTGVFMAAWKEHVALYPVTAGVTAAMKKDIAPFQKGKGTLQFRYDETLPVKLISRFVKIRATEVDELIEQLAAKKALKKKKR